MGPKITGKLASFLPPVMVWFFWLRLRGSCSCTNPDVLRLCFSLYLSYLWPHSRSLVTPLLKFAVIGR